jgi:hypothetical protein
MATLPYRIGQGALRRLVGGAGPGVPVPAVAAGASAGEGKDPSVPGPASRKSIDLPDERR